MEILTYSGNFEKQKDCIEIDGIWYKKFKINDKNADGAVRIDNKYIPTQNLKFNFNTQRWTDDPFLIAGYVDNFEKGWFENDKTKVCQVQKNPEELIKNFYDFSKLPDEYVFCPYRFVYTKVPNKPQKGIKPTYNFAPEVYDADQNNLFKDFCQMYNILPAEQETVLSSLFKKYTFGLELETSGGGIPEHECYDKLLIPLKDGSISGHEYVTVPMTGAKGFNLLTQQLELLSKNCLVDPFCSMHIHFSGMPKTVDYITSLYFLCFRLQHEVAELFAPYKRKVEYFKEKKEVKDHCENLPRLGNHMEDNYFEKIITHMNDGNLPNFEGVFPMIHNQNGNSKWNWKRRYYWVNFLPFLFKKQGTVEFRFHSGTLNKYKVHLWMLICQAILHFAEINRDEVMDYKSKLNLEEVLGVYKDVPFIYNTLIAYVSHRKNKHYDLSIGKDIYGNEFAEDSDYEFTYAGKSIYEWEKEQEQGA